MTYLVLLWLHLIGAAILFGTGLGIAFFCLEPEAKKTIHDFCAVREAIYAPPQPAETAGSGEFEAITTIPEGDEPR